MPAHSMQCTGEIIHEKLRQGGAQVGAGAAAGVLCPNEVGALGHTSGPGTCNKVDYALVPLLWQPAQAEATLC